MDDKRQHPICSELVEGDNKHCAALVITANFIKDQRGRDTVAQPSDELRNGTITFVKSQGRVYGITCWHIIEHSRKTLQNSGKPHSHTMRTMVNGFYIILDRFFRPAATFGNSILDIAIRELNKEFLSKIGKSAINLDDAPNAPSQIKHAYAVGFPELLKYKKFEDEIGYRVSMPHVSILAEIDRFPTQRFSLFSEFAEVTDQTDFSGMSGGPIYWSTEEEYGILGIIYESATGLELFGKKSVHVSGELATPDIIRGWIGQYHNQTV